MCKHFNIQFIKYRSVSIVVAIHVSIYWRECRRNVYKVWLAILELFDSWFFGISCIFFNRNLLSIWFVNHSWSSISKSSSIFQTIPVSTWWTKRICCRKNINYRISMRLSLCCRFVSALKVFIVFRGDAVCMQRSRLKSLSFVKR